MKNQNFTTTFTVDQTPQHPVKFILVSVFAFIASVWATAYFSHSMSGGMDMPGGWTMSMMWMQMSGQTWFSSAISFLIMWMAMMVAMMMPSVLPMFLKTRRHWASLCYMTLGYFTIWLVAGIGIYAIGMAFAAVAMRSDLFSRSIPLLSGLLLIISGAIQFTPWKMTHLLQCRSLFGCAVSYPQEERSFWLGCKQGAACCACSASPMAVLIVLGIMNPIVMIVIAIVIAAEKLLPWPDIVARLVGISAMIAGIVILSTVFLQPSHHSSMEKSSKVMSNM